MKIFVTALVAGIFAGGAAAAQNAVAGDFLLSYTDNSIDGGGSFEDYILRGRVDFGITDGIGVQGDLLYDRLEFSGPGNGEYTELTLHPYYQFPNGIKTALLLGYYDGNDGGDNFDGYRVGLEGMFPIGPDATFEVAAGVGDFDDDDYSFASARGFYGFGNGLGAYLQGAYYDIDGVSDSVSEIGLGIEWDLRASGMMGVPVIVSAEVARWDVL